MKWEILIFLLFFSFNNMVLAKNDTTDLKFGIGLSGMVSGSNDLHISLNPNVRISTYNYEIGAGIIISQNMKLWKGPQSWGPYPKESSEGKYLINGFSAHYRFILSPRKKLCGTVGGNFNYIKYETGKKNSDFYSSLTNYETVLTIGIRWKLNKQISVVPEIGLGHRYYEDKFYNKYYTTPNQEIKRNALNGLLKLSLNCNLE